MADVSKTRAAPTRDDSRLNPLSRMLKQSSAVSASATKKTSAATPAQVASPATGSAAVIGVTIKIKGDVTGKEDVFVNGRIEGTVELPDNVIVVEKAGHVKGSIRAKRAQIRGKVAGDIEALEKITISSTGAIRGTIVAPRVQIEDGATFKGRVEMDFEEDRGRTPLVSQRKG